MNARSGLGITPRATDEAKLRAHVRAAVAQMTSIDMRRERLETGDGRRGGSLWCMRAYNFMIAKHTNIIGTQPSCGSGYYLYIKLIK